MHAVHVSGRDVIQIIGDQDRGETAKIAGQVMHRQLARTGFQLEVTGNFPDPGIRGLFAQNRAVVFAVDQQAEGAGAVGAKPVAITNPYAVGSRGGNLNSCMGILDGDAGLICGHQITAAHQMDKLGVFFPTAFVLKFYGINPKFCVCLHQ